MKLRTVCVPIAYLYEAKVTLWHVDMLLVYKRSAEHLNNTQTKSSVLTRGVDGGGEE